MEIAHRILVIDNDEATIRLLRERLIVNGGYSVHCESSVMRALDIFNQNNFDIVIVKFDMIDFEPAIIINNLKKRDPDCIIIALIENADSKIIKDVSRMGVYDFITKPVNLEKLFFLVRKGIDLHLLAVTNHKLTQSLKEHNLVLQKQNTLLAKRIEESTKNLTRLYEDLRQTYMRTIKTLAQTIDAKDHYTHSHSENVAKYAVAIAEELGLSASDIEILREACELHDLGKIGVDDSILNKPSSLTKEEWEQIKRHPMTGAQILEPLTFLNGVIDLIKQHHEHYDGSGYPEGRRGEDIFLSARIIHIADAYEAMRSARSYRKIPLTKDEAILEIKKHIGTQFDPKVAGAFLKVVDKFDP